jgi:ribonuclease P protein component
VRTLSKRSEFLAANRGLRFPMPGFVLLVRQRGDDADDSLGIGYTVSKKVGNSPSPATA